MYPDEGIDMNETCSSSSGGRGGGGDDLIGGASRVAAAPITDEPYEGMEFETEEAARVYYEGYARRVGFVVRLRTCHRTEKGGKAIARRMGCNKEGYRDIDRRNPTPKNPRPITRGGCKAMIYVKYITSSGKWIVSRLVKEHNHPLVVLSPPRSLDSTEEKDRKIRRLTSELQNEERLCAAYREQLTTFLKIIEEQNDHISIRVQSVVDNLKQYERRDEESQSSNPS